MRELATTSTSALFVRVLKMRGTTCTTENTVVDQDSLSDVPIICWYQDEIANYILQEYDIAILSGDYHCATIQLELFTINIIPNATYENCVDAYESALWTVLLYLLN